MQNINKRKQAFLVSDPIDNFIINEVIHLQQQNERLKSYVETSGLWAEMKDIDKWKPFDFLHYFCNLFQRKYRKEYKISGNIVRNYQRIETFMSTNKIDNVRYKQFIDMAFSRHFTNNVVPNMGHIVSAVLYNKLFGDNVKKTKTQDWFDLDATIQRENIEFENASAEPFNYTFLDSKIIKEDARFRAALLTGCV